MNDLPSSAPVRPGHHAASVVIAKLHAFLGVAVFIAQPSEPVRWVFIHGVKSHHVVKAMHFICLFSKFQSDIKKNILIRLAYSDVA